MSKKLIDKYELLNVPIGTIVKYRVEELHKLLFEVSRELERAKRTKQWIEAAIAIKYEEQMCAKRIRLAKDNGVIHLEDDDFKVTCDIPKKVEWNQELLAKVAKDIVLGGGNLIDYIETRYNVPERLYNGWPESVRSLFTPARSIRLGRPTYKLVKLNNSDGGEL